MMGLRRTAHKTHTYTQTWAEPTPKPTVVEARDRTVNHAVLLTLIIYRLGHHVASNAEVQPLQGRLQLHTHVLKHSVICSQRGQEGSPDWRGTLEFEGKRRKSLRFLYYKYIICIFQREAFKGPLSVFDSNRTVVCVLR